jgi:hypothetical protein
VSPTDANPAGRPLFLPAAATTDAGPAPSGDTRATASRDTTAIESNLRPVRLAYQPPASSNFLSEQTRHQQPASITFLSQQISTSHQPPAKRTGC